MNANPGTLVSLADCLIGYGPWLAPIEAGEVSHLPGHNSSYTRDVLLAYGDRLDDLLEAETVLHWDLLAHGHRLFLEPRATLAHTNFALPAIWTRVQLQGGRMFGATRAHAWPWSKRALFVIASPLIPLVRLRRIWPSALRVSRRRSGGSAAQRLPRWFLLRLLPVLVWGLLMDAVGQMLGYAIGAGRAARRVADYEFDRMRYVTQSDRRALDGRARDEVNTV